MLTKVCRSEFRYSSWIQTGKEPFLHALNKSRETSNAKIDEQKERKYKKNNKQFSRNGARRVNALRMKNCHRLWRASREWMWINSNKSMNLHANKK